MGKQKRKGKKPARSLRRKSRGGLPATAVKMFVSSGHYTFWLAHGANYLASPLGEGLWRPIFNVYDGLGLTPGEIRTEVAFLYQTDEGVQDPGPAILGWCGQKPSKVLSFYEGLRDKATTEQRARLRDPYVEYVWRAFQPLHRVRL
jgi:hypothetical protein